MAKNKPEEYKLIKVITETLYIIPMHDKTRNISSFDARTPEDLRDEWFKKYSLNQSHATRDRCELGNSIKILCIEILDG